MTDDEWFRQWNALNNEIERAIDSFFRWKAIRNFAAGSAEALRLMNQTPAFWITITDDLQASYIITLGRIFDTDQRSHSMQTFLDETAQNPELFTIEALRRRKIIGSEGSEPDWLASYLEDARCPTTDEFTRLRGSIGAQKRRWQTVYDPVRNKMFAHRDRNANLQGLLSGTRIGEIDEILRHIHAVMGSLLQLYANGRLVSFSDKPFDEEARITAETNKVMSRLTMTQDAASKQKQPSDPRSLDDFLGPE